MPPSGRAGLGPRLRETEFLFQVDVAVKNAGSPLEGVCIDLSLGQMLLEPLESLVNLAVFQFEDCAASSLLALRGSQIDVPEPPHGYRGIGKGGSP